MISKLDHSFKALNQFLKEHNPSKIFILVDENTHEYCLPILLPNLETNAPFELIEVEAGEENKNIATATQLWEILADFEADRKSLMMNLGGGVITDMGGFVASTYKRGIPFVNIPTSLLAMSDASIGGKTGIDLQYLKNIVGTFANAQQIFVYPDFLKTLPFEELRSGFAEMLKHGLIADEKHWEDLISISELTPENIAPYIERSMQIKQEVVEIDFKEQNIRKTLNFGHTIGHAVESLFLKSDKIIPHGEAVALGMICETKLAELEQLIDKNTSDTVIEKIRLFYPYISINHFSDEEIMTLMVNDKKNSESKINFSLITGIGTCNFNYNPSTENILKALEYYRAHK